MTSYQGPTYAMYEFEFGVRMVRAVERIAFAYNEVPMALRRGLYRTDTHHYRNELS